MKKVLAMLSILFLVSVPNAFAINFSVEFTGDNVVNMYTVAPDGSTNNNLLPAGDPALSNWQQTNVFNFTNFDPRSSLVWEVTNVQDPIIPPEFNPGGFIAEITGNVEFTAGSLLTSSAWLVSLDGQNWVEATEYGANSADILWTQVNGGPVGSIDDDAQWIWWETNHALSPDVVFVKIDFAEPVPEPSTIVLLGIGIIGLIGAGRKFRK